MTLSWRILGVVAIVLAAADSLTAPAEIIYTAVDPPQTVLPPGTLDIDLDNDGAAEFRLTLGLQMDLSIQPIGSGISTRVVYQSGRYYAAALWPCEAIVGAGAFNAGSLPMVLQGSGPWSGANNRYLGLRFSIGGEAHLAWVKLDVSGGNAQPFIEGYAYNDVPEGQPNGDAICAGVAPTFTLPNDETVECDGNGNTAAFEAWKQVATVTDACTPGLVAEPVEVSATPGCGNTIVYTYRWTATDGCHGVTQSETRTFTIQDTTAPTFTLPSDETVECDGNGNTAAFEAWKQVATVTDACTPGLVAEPVEVSATPGCGNTIVYTYRWTATDGCHGVTQSETRTFTIQDTTAPTIETCPGDKVLAASLSCTAVAPDVTSEITASDVCGGQLTVAQSPAAGALLGLGQTQITVTVSDACNNASQCALIVSVIDDIAPVLTCPPDLTILCDDSILPSSTGEAWAADNCDPLPTVTHTDSVVFGDQADRYEILRDWKAVDQGGNASQETQRILVVDGTPPVILDCPADRSLEADETGHATVPDYRPDVAAEDNCDDSPAVEQEPPPGTLVGAGTLEVTIRVTDRAGLSTTCKMVINVIAAVHPAPEPEPEPQPEPRPPTTQPSDGVPTDLSGLPWQLLRQSFCGVPLCGLGWMTCIPPTCLGLLVMKTLRRRQGRRHERR